MTTPPATPDPRYAAFYQVLRRFYADRGGGARRVIRAFEADPDGRADALAALLHDALPADRQALADQILHAMGPDDGAQFVNLVTGGRVEQLVNIARLGVLVIQVEQTWIVRVFQDVRQVVAFLVILLLALTAVSLAVWRSRQPAVMRGDFNVAVATFAEANTTNPAADGRIAAAVSRRIAAFLDQEAQLISAETVQVAHDKIGVITDGAQAQALAARIHADLVIYGDVTVVGDTAQITPRFYVAEPYRPDVGEIGGQHQLALPVTFATADLLNPDSAVNAGLQQRMAILTGFTKGLAYRAADAPRPALTALEQAIAQAEAYGRFAGAEVLYLLASDAARLLDDLPLAERYAHTALQLNPTYGRAYIALGNIAYDRGDAFQARRLYAQALDQPADPGAYVAEKAQLNIGNLLVLHLQEMHADPLAPAAEKTAVANDTLAAYQAVIDTFENTPSPDLQLQSLTAWAYYGAGIAYQVSGACPQAAAALHAALSLSDDPDLAARANRRLAEVAPCAKDLATD